MQMHFDIFTRAAQLQCRVYLDSKLERHYEGKEQTQKEQYDKRHAVKKTKFAFGQRVNIHRSVRSDKSTPKWTAEQGVASQVGR